MGEIEDLQDEIASLELEKSTMVEGWMATYGDMVTLLLCFFVLLFAFFLFTPFFGCLFCFW